MEIQAANPERVKILLDHLMAEHNRFCDLHPEIENVDAFMAVHNFHVLFVLNLEQAQKLDTERQLFLRQTAIDTFRQAMENKPAFSQEDFRMNIDTGHLVDTSGMPEEELRKLARSGYFELPPHLAGAARQALDGQKETTVDLDSGSQLAKWAEDQRAARKAQDAARARRKARRKMAKESRRRNRG